MDPNVTTRDAVPLPDDITITDVIAVRGVGAQILGALSLSERLRSRQVSRAFLSAVDESLEELSSLFWEDLGHVASQSGGLDWLAQKCPNLLTLSLWPRTHIEMYSRSALTLTHGCRLGRSDMPPQSLLGIGRCTRLRALKVGGCADVTDHVLASVAASCPDLETLDVSYCRVTDAGISQIALRCGCLRELSTAGSRRVTDASIQQIALHCGDCLRRLDVGGTSVTDASISAIAERCGNVRHLAAGDCRSVTDASIQQVAQRCPELRHLDVGGVAGVTDVGVAAIARGCPGLTGLNVSHCGTGRGDVRDPGMSAVATHCPRLKYLNVTGLQHVSRSVLLELVTRCPQLQHLDAEVGHGVDDDVIVALAGNGCSGLRHLAVGYSSFVADAGIVALAERCPLLEHLSVLSCCYVTDAGISAVARGCPLLRHLDVRSCGRVTSVSLSDVGERCQGLEELRVNATTGRAFTRSKSQAVARACAGLRFVEVGHMDKSLLRAVVQNCSRLERLCLWRASFSLDWFCGVIGHECGRLRSFEADNCRTLSDKNVAALLEGPVAGQLLRLSFHACHDITDNSMVVVGQICTSLRSLEVASVQGVTDVGLRAVAMGCRRLTYLDVSGCEVTLDGLGMFNLDECNVVHHRIQY